MRRNIIVLTALCLAAGPVSARTPTKAPVCAPTTAFTTALEQLKGYRVFTGPDGNSAVEPIAIDPRRLPFFKTGKTLKLFDLPKVGTRAPYIVVGPPNVELPLHPAPYKEMFVLLGGSVTVKTAKFSADLKPGSVLLFEDVDAKDGHGGRIGPCGYISLSIAP